MVWLILQRSTSNGDENAALYDCGYGYAGCHNGDAGGILPDLREKPRRLGRGWIARTA